MRQNFSSIYCFSCYLHIICSISVKHKVFCDLIKLQNFCISPTQTFSDLKMLKISGDELEKNLFHFILTFSRGSQFL